MKVVAMPAVYFYDLSLWKAMDAARFFSLVDRSSSSSTCDCMPLSHDVMRKGL